jgi:hypothetical protein
VVAKVDRLGRSAGEVLTLVERANREGWRLVALDAGLDSATPSGQLVTGVLACAAAFEHGRISERQHEKFAVLRRLERPRGRPPARRDVADRILRMRADGVTFRRIAETLNAGAIATPQGGRAWTAASVRSAAITRQREVDAADAVPRQIGSRPLVFPDPAGGYIDLHNLRARSWIPARDAAGIGKGRRIYDLRHTFASNALAQGVSVIDLARWMGTRVRMIEAHYGHPVVGATEAARAKLNAIGPGR